MAQIKILNGKSADLCLDLPVGETLEIGTKRKAFVRLRDTGVSYVHAQLQFDGSVLTLSDCKSQAGTFVGDAAVGADAVTIAPESTFRIASTEIQFLLAPVAPPEPVTPAVDTKAHDELKANYDKLHGELTRVKSQSETISLERDKLRSTLDEVRSQLQEAEEIASDTVETANELEANNRDLQAEINALNSKLQTEVKQAQTAAKEQIDDLQEEVEALASERESLNNELHENRAALEKLKADLEAANAKLQSLEADHNKAANDLKTQLEAKAAELQSSQSKITELEQSNEDLQKSMASHEDTLKSHQAQIEELDLTLTQTTREAIMTEVRNQELTGRGCDLIEELDAEEQTQLSVGIYSLFREHDVAVDDDGESLAHIQSEVERLKAERA